jgi:hypothetical protein
MPRVLTDEHRHLGMVEITMEMGSEHVAVDPRLPCLLLGQRVRAILNTEGTPQSCSVGATEMIALSTAP